MIKQFFIGYFPFHSTNTIWIWITFSVQMTLLQGIYETYQAPRKGRRFFLQDSFIFWEGWLQRLEWISNTRPCSELGNWYMKQKIIMKDSDYFRLDIIYIHKPRKEGIRTLNLEPEAHMLVINDLFSIALKGFDIQ